MKTKLMERIGERTQKPLHYTDCGLDDVYLLNGYTIERDSDGEEGISIKDLDGLHRAIGKYLATQKKALSGKELRFLRKQLNFTQSHLGTLLGLSSQQVARWEKEESEISGPADRLVRGLYIESIFGKIDLKKLVDCLDAIDVRINEKLRLKETPQGWKQAA
jgi:putative transcriptional regulator